MSLTQEQIETYKKNGYLGVEGVFSGSELDDLRRVTEEYVEQSRDYTEHTDEGINSSLHGYSAAGCDEMVHWTLETLAA